jgi:hypothetical protein
VNQNPDQVLFRLLSILKQTNEFERRKNLNQIIIKYIYKLLEQDLFGYFPSVSLIEYGYALLLLSKTKSLLQLKVYD